MKKLIYFLYHLAFLFLLPIIFITAYVIKWFNPVATIYEHLGVAAAIILAIFVFKLLINHHLHNRRYALILHSVIYSGFIFIISIYYLTVLIGLHSWGRVITKEFIISYVNQAAYFFDTINVSHYFVIGIIIIFYAVIFAISYLFLRKFIFMPIASYKNRLWLMQLLLLSGLIFLMYSLHDYTITSNALSREPLKLTLFSGESKLLQSHDYRQGKKVEEKLNQLENLSRKNYAPIKSSKKRNLIVIVVDALRPDHMSVYGYKRDTTPNLKKMAQSQATTKFTNLHSTCGETTCAHASYMASRFIHQLPSNLFTLQEVLKLNGYQTNMIISGDHIRFNNIRDVYGEVDDYYDGSMAKGFYFNDDAITTNKTKDLPIWNGRPIMIHYHLLSAHIVGKKYPQYLRYTPAKNYLLTSNGLPDPRYTNFYDNGVLQADAVIKELLDTLQAKNI